MSLVTPNTNTLNVNNEVTQHGNGNGNRSLSCLLATHTHTHSHSLERETTAEGPYSLYPVLCLSLSLFLSRLTFDTVTAFSDLFHVDMRRSL